MNDGYFESVTKKYKKACAEDGCNGDVLLIHPDRLKELLEKK